MNIDHIVLWVDNQQRSLAFFVDLLGMDPVRSDVLVKKRQTLTPKQKQNRNKQIP